MKEERNHNLFEKLSNLQWLVQRHRLKTYASCGPFADPTRGQGRVLAVLKLQPELSTKDLSYLLGIRQQSLSELLGKLEKAGYITRRPSSEDKRVVLVQITQKGREQQQETDTDLDSIFDCLSEGEQTAFEEYLDRIIQSLEKENKGSDRKDMRDWMRAARDRMGDEKFERLMGSMYRGVQKTEHHIHRFFDEARPFGERPDVGGAEDTEGFYREYDSTDPAEKGADPADGMNENSEKTQGEGEEVSGEI